jgi:hypothetical protein
VRWRLRTSVEKRSSEPAMMASVLT